MLLIDIGNTRLKWMYHDSHGIIIRGAFEYHMNFLSEMFDTELKSVPQQAVWIASVVEPARNITQQWFEAKWNVKPNFVQSAKKFLGLTNGYALPESLGVDRWLAMLATFNSCAQPVCVIDCGTAVTFDVVDKKGIHQGGLIMPGLKLMQKSLLLGADSLKGVGLSAIKHYTLADNTQDGVIAGCALLLASGLSKLCVQQVNFYGNNMKMVMTGGDAETIAPLMEVSCMVEPDLVLQGLQLVAGFGSQK